MKLQDIFELTHYRSMPVYNAAKDAFSNTSTLDDAMIGMAKFDKFMQDHKFTKLGNGAFANVYERPGYSWVFKVFTRDPAYMEWIRYITAHQSNEHVPKLRGAPFKINNHTFALRMEKLTPIADNYDQHPLLDAIIWGGVPLTNNSRNTIESSGHMDLIDVLTAIANITYNNTNNTTDYSPDLHRYNLMMRGNTVVITDPVVDRAQFR